MGHAICFLTSSRWEILSCCKPWCSTNHNKGSLSKQIRMAPFRGLEASATVGMMNTLTRGTGRLRSKTMDGAAAKWELETLRAG